MFGASTGPLNFGGVIVESSTEFKKPPNIHQVINNIASILINIIRSSQPFQISKFGQQVQQSHPIRSYQPKFDC